MRRAITPRFAKGPFKDAKRENRCCLTCFSFSDHGNRGKYDSPSRHSYPCTCVRACGTSRKSREFCIDRPLRLLKSHIRLFLKSWYKMYITINTIDVRQHTISGLRNVTLRLHVTIEFTVRSSSVCRALFVDARNYREIHAFRAITFSPRKTGSQRYTLHFCKVLPSKI